MTTPNNENDTNNSNIDKVVVKIEQKTESVKKVDANAILSTGTLPDGTKYHVRLMRLDDVDEVLQVWKSIGLYEGTNTIQSFHAIDPEGFYVAVSEKDGSIIGEVGAVFIEPTTAFIGLYAVRPDCQKMGVGYAVWKQMMKHVGEANVGLYALDTQYDMYRNKAKLEIEDPVKIVEFKKIGETSPETLANLTQSINNVELVQALFLDVVLEFLLIQV
uniref:N-acetyltransferase domain-containing protein n=1 Tax=Tetranychus urticae TaxID=32264 RepID=T1KSU3_TETUR